MKKVRVAEFTGDKKLPIIMIVIAAFMLILSVVKVEISSLGLAVGLNNLASVVSVMPLTAGASAFMLIRTKKSAFGELPCYVISFFIAMAIFLLFLFKLVPEGFEVFGFALGILLIYPYIIAGITIRGCIYNRVFALGFAGLLAVISLIGVIIASVLIQGFMLSLLILPLMYVELVLNILCFELKPIKKAENN